MLKIPFYKPSVGEDEIHEVIETIRSGWLTTGPKTKQFETQFASYVGQPCAVAVNSCTAALHLALESIGVKPEQGVLVPAMTFAATAEVVRYLGAHPVLVDCRAADFNIDIADAERRILKALGRNETIAAIIPVHYGGQIGDVASIQALARKYSLKVVEDAAHSCPAYYREEQKPQVGDQGVEGGGGTESTTHEGQFEKQITEITLNSELTAPDYAAKGWKPVGADADISCFSFYANKCITTGEGGMACTKSEAYAERMRIMSLHGISKDAWKRFTAEGSWYYEIVAPGYKYNMTDIAAAIGIHQLRRADMLHQQRRRLASFYTRLLEDIDELILPREAANRVHSWHLYAIRLKLDRLEIGRAEVIQQMKERGIGTSVHWLPLHMHPYYREKYGYKPNDFPISANIYPQLITLPLYPDMNLQQVEFVCDALRSILARNLKPSVRAIGKPLNLLERSLQQN